ncbi:hypothetical protein [Levilactobacillus acidifarinae]|uniref:Uncharacterized protein n=1 Tax=Levilactobacillus acidifarinae DSM 19394 = JCM 15949 TaxID=1423715 RepID=A0A0R1LXS3_9LACO|nr:hypothetical protein [Levilactobacillus acidifarinae]KRK96535.1 hypothetical protein FD25_GL002032 [Levilactobacillus acidifarinae DSM 19394]GEO70445.1 hypothetical protein LAC03_23550 [Levilactobacillus acidifarinae]
MAKKFVTSHDILLDDENATLIPGMVNDPSMVADADGNKYMRGGTLLTADKEFDLNNDGSVVLVPTTDATVAQGILRQDYNILDGPVPASIIISGTINRHQMDEDTQKVYTSELKKALKAVLPKISVVDRY